MQKTKLGISVGMVGAAMFFFCLFGGYIPALLLGGYILLAEDNIWLKKTAVKAIALSVCFSILTILIGLIPDFINIIRNFSTMIEEVVNLSKADSLFNIILIIVDIVEILLFLVLGLSAFSQGTVKIPFIDNMISKYMD